MDTIDAQRVRELEDAMAAILGALTVPAGENVPAIAEALEAVRLVMGDVWWYAMTTNSGIGAEIAMQSLRGRYRCGSGGTY
jgi:hypothetical protein